MGVTSLTPSEENLKSMVRRARHGVLFDTNVLCMHIAISSDVPLDRWKPTRSQVPELVHVVAWIALHARAFRTTPHVLTEVDYFVGEAQGDYRMRLQDTLCAFADVARESAVAARSLMGQSLYRELGLADASTAGSRKRHPLVVTDDGGLIVALERAGRPVVNPTHYLGL